MGGLGYNNKQAHYRRFWSRAYMVIMHDISNRPATVYGMVSCKSILDTGVREGLIMIVGTARAMGRGGWASG